MSLIISLAVTSGLLVGPKTGPVTSLVSPSGSDALDGLYTAWNTE